ncbi:MAG TPA: MlaD family protein [Nocardioidaceae bacterium]|nr:MlaD family protein [Nocardioidaceae bacterium]
MISQRTKIQLVIFLVITVLGVSYVGARYAQLDRFIVDKTYSVTAHFADSGGIFEGAEVSYRGVQIGRVGDLELTSKGVDVVMDIDNEFDQIPADAFAIVGNRSAVGEQYIELQPASDDEPYLETGSEIPPERTAIPISSTKWLLDASRLVNSVDKQSLTTVVNELGAAFADTGDDLGQIIDTSTSFIEAANDNFDITTQLIKDSNLVLRTQLDKASAIRAFSRNLALVSDTLAAGDQDLRTIIENGSATANQLRTFLERNKVDLGQLINNLVTTGEVAVRHLPGTEMILVLYPYVVAGAYIVVDKATSDDGNFYAHFGMALANDPAVCHQGYDPAERRPPLSTRNKPMDEDARCTEPRNVNPRGAAYAPRSAPIATYDRSSGKVTFTDENAPVVTYDGGASIYGKDSWRALLLQPFAAE